MEEYRKKTGNHSKRKPGTEDMKQEQSEEKEQEGSAVGDNKKKRGFFRKERQESGKESRDAQKEGPVSFNAHALDMDPGFVLPARPSVDLTYNDFTRESYDTNEGRVFVPKKKHAVPFELSDTPRTQQDPREGKPTDRRKATIPADPDKQSAAPRDPDSMKEIKPADIRKEPAEQAKEKRDKQRAKPERNKVQQDIKTKGHGKHREQIQTDETTEYDARLQHKTREAAGGGQQPAREADAQDSRQQTKAAGKQEKGEINNKAQKPLRFTERAKAQNDRKQDAGDDSRGVNPESGKESLIRPYWLKK